MKTIHPMCDDCHYHHSSFYNCDGGENGCHEWYKSMYKEDAKDWSKEVPEYKP